jgi:hypothetical protein
MVLRIGEGPPATDRHEAGVADFREDQTLYPFCIVAFDRLRPLTHSLLHQRGDLGFVFRCQLRQGEVRGPNVAVVNLRLVGELSWIVPVTID